MNSEKVKEIKELLKCMNGEKACTNCYINDIAQEQETCCINVVAEEVIDYINELESENERLNKSDTSKEESSIEYYNLYKDLKRKNKDLNELCELQRVSIAESFVRENQLKDRIAELEKENAIKTDTIIDLLKKQEFYEKEKLKQFAEMLKEKAIRRQEFIGELAIDYIEYVKVKDIDETLKEFING